MLFCQPLHTYTLFWIFMGICSVLGLACWGQRAACVKGPGRGCGCGVGRNKAGTQGPICLGLHPCSHLMLSTLGHVNLLQASVCSSVAWGK